MLKILSSCAALCLMPLTALADAPKVVTDLAPVQSLVAMVAGERFEPSVLMDEAGDGHHFALRPSQARALASADLVIWTGPQMAPWMARALEGAAAGAGQLALLNVPGTYLRSWEEADHAEHDEDHAGHDHDVHEHGHDHEHDHGSMDPHAWLEPGNAIAWLEAIAAALTTVDPENATQYQANAVSAALKLTELDAELRALLDQVADRPFVVGHDAYGYFTSHYGLKVAGSLATGDAANPSAAHLSALRERLAQDQVVCAFPEIGQSPRLLNTALEGTSVKIGEELDPAGSSLAKGAGQYEALMRDLAAKISSCLKS